MHIKNKSQVRKAMFLANDCSLALYDEDLEKWFIIDHEQIQFNKNDGWDLIGIPEKEDGNFSDHDYFCIHDDTFDRIQSTLQDRNILWMFISIETNEDES